MNGTPFTLGILILTSLVSVMAFGSRSILARYAESPYDIVRHGRWEQLLTSGFLHADLGHLFFNMFTLFSFGPLMERVLGGPGFLILYLGSMLCGGLLTLAAHARDPNYRAVGASGAISGVLFGFVLLRPFAGLYIFFIPVPIPAILFAAVYVIASVAGMRHRWGHIGHEAHLGGALGGVVLTILLFPAAVRIFLGHFR